MLKNLETFHCKYAVNTDNISHIEFNNIEKSLNYINYSSELPILRKLSEVSNVEFSTLCCKEESIIIVSFELYKTTSYLLRSSFEDELNILKQNKDMVYKKNMRLCNINMIGSSASINIFCDPQDLYDFLRQD